MLGVALEEKCFYETEKKNIRRYLIFKIDRTAKKVERNIAN